jgi:hypothetical protein
LLQQMPRHGPNLRFIFRGELLFCFLIVVIQSRVPEAGNSRMTSSITCSSGMKLSMTT